LSEERIVVIVNHNPREVIRRLTRWAERRDPVRTMLLPTWIWEELESTYAGAGTADNWEALFRTMALFRRVATEVADDLGHVYPLDLDRRVTAYVREIRDLHHGARSCG
jgi:hypothetical protein